MVTHEEKLAAIKQWKTRMNPHDQFYYKDGELKEIYIRMEEQDIGLYMDMVFLELPFLKADFTPDTLIKLSFIVDRDEGNVVTTFQLNKYKYEMGYIYFDVIKKFEKDDD